jgi:hypothetical protein
MQGTKLFYKKLAISMSQPQNIPRIYEVLVLLWDFQVFDGGDGFPDISNDVGTVGAWRAPARYEQMRDCGRCRELRLLYIRPRSKKTKLT